MRARNARPILKQLSSTQGLAPAIAPGGVANFEIDGLPGRVGDLWCYLQGLWVYAQFTLDQAAAAGVVGHWYDMTRVLASLQLQTPDLGTLYSAAQTTGGRMGSLFGPVSAGYKAPGWQSRRILAQDNNYTVQVAYRIPLGHPVLEGGAYCAPWAGLANNGRLELEVAAATVFAPPMTGAAISGNVTLRCVAELSAEPEARIATPAVWRTYETPGNSTQHKIRGVGQSGGLNGVEPGSRLAWFSYNTDARSILGGPDGVDNITAIETPFRNQENLRFPEALLDQFYLDSMGLQTRTGDVPPVVSPDWPVFSTDSGDVLLRSNSAVGFLPILWPTVDQRITKMQKWLGDIDVNATYTATPANPGQWSTLEVFEYREDYKEYLRERMAIPAGTPRGKKLLDHQGRILGNKGAGLPDKFTL